MSQLRAITGLLMAIGLAGCGAAANMATVNDSAYASVSSYASVELRRDSAGSYLLNPGDHVRVKAYSDDQLSNDYEVNSSGFVSIPLVGNVKAAGLTTRQLEHAIIARMKGRIAKNPQINVEIATYAPFYIYGEVRKAGQYPFQPGLTVGDAIATAGGLTYRANEYRVYVRHAGSAREQVVAADAPARVYPGDNIRVTERIF